MRNGDRTRRATGRRSLLRMPLALLALLALVALAMCAGGWSSGHAAGATISAAGPYVKLQQTTRVAPWRPSLVAPRGGRASFQLVVDGGGEVRPSAGRLLGENGASLPAAASVLRERTVPVTATSDAVKHGLTGAVPDPLVPVSVRRQAGMRQVFWVTIVVPRTQRPGVYRGTIAVGARSFAYRLRVAAVTLPVTHAVHTWFLVWGRHADAAEHRSGARALYTRVLTSYGIGDGTAAGGDAAVGLRPHALAGSESDATLRALARGVAGRAARLKARTPGAVPYSYVYDEPPASQLGSVRRWGAALHQEAPQVRQLVTAPTDGSLGAAVGAWSMHLRDLTPEMLAQTHALGAEAWAYSSCCEAPGNPTLLLDQDAVGNLAVVPATWLQGGTGLLYWSVNDYTGDPYSDAQNTGDDVIANGDGWLLYPGRPFGLRAPNASIRLALVAAGLQISDEAALLAHRGQGDWARAQLARVLPGTAQFVDNPASWHTVELALLQRLERTT
ncbi:MAG: hypothetical protein QOK36_2173 [Gaiellales bacterium]|nr:hypothetical protein [Gaiellales bacterium]